MGVPKAVIQLDNELKKRKKIKHSSLPRTALSLQTPNYSPLSRLSTKC